ncbi:uncharacterized protein BDR25DRAFT_365243 [Lindgomyces ingoldianus]|uniref:Uncharacterized protein n=1 Tax=Lindgomyces ingoldianus TaxID=673940 RepID=A0ACB6RGJ3_9PLEO|nr:uncharacterized protein BDR25DRAFT_365243 [Lindgomyces ingoldianus]KAF2478170.1 hypothetical protein BDR25DRAFT_365243 [Lindgomyces ingoldianus]
MKTLAAIIPFLGVALAATQAQTHLFACKERMFTGICTNIAVNSNACYELTTLGADWVRAISSASPDQGSTCTLYNEEGCTGTRLKIAACGINDLKDLDFDKTAVSFKCK